jgi:hypothetical protein
MANRKKPGAPITGRDIQTLNGHRDVMDERVFKRLEANLRSMVDTCMWQLEHEIGLTEVQRNKVLSATDSLLQQFNDDWAAYANVSPRRDSASSWITPADLLAIDSMAGADTGPVTKPRESFVMSKPLDGLLNSNDTKNSGSILQFDELRCRRIVWQIHKLPFTNHRCKCPFPKITLYSNYCGILELCGRRHV